MADTHSKGQHRRWGDDKRRQEMSDRFRELWQDPEYRQRMLDARRKPWTPERRAAAIERGKLRKHTEEEKRKISESNRGKKMSADARAKMSAAKKGKPQSEEIKRHLSTVLKGRVVSEETKQRMSIGQKALYDNPEYRKRRGELTRRFWASLTAEEKSKIALPGRLACLESTRLREPTSIERAVADEIMRLGIKFEQQVIFKYYVADIYLPDHRVIIECDGDYWHSTSKMKAHDAKRDRWFIKHGMKVVRLKERDIRTNTKAAVQEGLKDILWES